VSLSAKQLKIATLIDTKVRKLERSGRNDMTIFIEMSDLMPEFKKLMDTTDHAGMDDLCARFAGFYRFAKILENIAGGIQSGQINVPR
jgi:hypothetical protein